MRLQHLALLVVGVALTFGLFLLAATPEADAIPAFSRNYRTSCATCHVAFPKLNAFGEAFRNNGYRMPGGDDQFNADDPVSLGAEGWKRLWPSAIWPGDMPYLPPVSLLIDGEYLVEPDAGVNNDFRIPSNTALLTGGNFGDTLSFFGRINLTAPGESLHIHRLFGQLNDLFDTNLLNVRFGQMEPRAVPFSSNRMLTSFDYLSNTQTFPLAEVLEAFAGEQGHGEEEEADGHLHGGDFALGTTQQGVEVWGVANGFGGRGGFEYGFGIVNGNGDGAFEDNGTNDNNSTKDVYWRASYKFGGMSLLGDAATAPTEAQNWRDDSLRIGTFGYRGSAPYEVPHGHGDEHGEPGFLDLVGDALRAVGSSPHRAGEDFTRYGFDLDLRFQDLNLFGAYMTGETRLDPFVMGVESDFRSWFTEADYVVFPWLIGALRYERVDLDLPGNGDLSRWVPHFTALIRANTKLTFDALLYPESSHQRNQYLFSFAFAF